MKLNDWINFNKPYYNGDLIVKVAKNKSYKSDDVLLSTVAHLDVCSKLFGDYDLAKFQVEQRPEHGGYTIKVLLWVEM